MTWIRRLGIAGTYQFGTASFGPAIGSPNVAATSSRPSMPSDAGGAGHHGRLLAVLQRRRGRGQDRSDERGMCGFAVKARNAAAAGALAVGHLQQRRECSGCPARNGRRRGPAVPIPAVSLARADGLTISVSWEPASSLDIGVDPTVRAGADALGRARVYAPFPVVGGSSISHYDTVASRNLLMEPAINPDLTHNVKAPYDLTYRVASATSAGRSPTPTDGFVDDERLQPELGLARRRS